MEREVVFLKLFGRKIISFKKLATGEILGTGLLNPIIDRLDFFTMLLVQRNFYKGYKNMKKWRGHRVANSFAPPVGSHPMLHLIKTAIKGRLFHNPMPVARPLRLLTSANVVAFIVAQVST